MEFLVLSGVFRLLCLKRLIKNTAQQFLVSITVKDYSTFDEDVIGLLEYGSDFSI